MKELSLEETQKVSLEILKEIARICEEKNLRYVLIYGTLLGAIRHKGFIPWDDDVDIMMPRPDYENLLKYLEQRKEDYENLEIFNNISCSEYPYMITRISDSRYIIDTENEKSYGLGIFIDIYPFDGIGDNKIESLSFGLKGDILSSLCYQSTREKFSFKNTSSSFKAIFKLPAYLYAKIMGKKYFQKKLSKLANNKNYDDYKYVGCIVWLSGGMRDIFEKEWFDKTLLLPFEDYKFRVPKNYEKVLEHIYGDYMKLPPIDQQIGHHFYRVFKK